MIDTIRRISRIATIVVILISINTLNAFNQDADKVVSGSIRIKLKPEYVPSAKGLSLNTKKGVVITGIKSLDAVNTNYNVTGMKRVFPYSPKFEDRHVKHGLHLWYEINFGTKASPASIAETYRNLPEIEISETITIPVLSDGSGSPAYYSVTSDTDDRSDALPFDDPYLKKQWHYNNYGQTGGTLGSDINLFNAWEINHGANNIIVAVMDQGVDYTHEDLKNMMWVNEAELNGVEGVDDDENGYRDDIYGVNFATLTGNINIGYHGTHVAGTIAAENNNGIGVCGVAGGSGKNDGVRIMTCQILGGSVAADIPSAYVYAADMGAVISQNSWGYDTPGVYDEAVHAGIDYFIEEAGNYTGSPMKGGVVFFASGNSNTEEMMYPGAYPSVVAVNGLNSLSNRASYSNYGDWTDISAPGGDDNDVELGTETGYSNAIMSTLNGNSYGYLSGTSMACPHVSGIAALVLSEYGNSEFTNEMLKTHIITGTRYLYDISGNEDLIGKLGIGYADATLALGKDNEIAPDKIIDLFLTGIAQDFATFSWTVPSDDDDDKPYSFEVLYSTSAITESNIKYAHSIIKRNLLDAGEKQEIEINDLQSVTDYYFCVRSIDRWGNASDISNTIMATTNEGPQSAFDPNKSSLEIDINTTIDPTGSDSIALMNSGAGLLRFDALTRLKSTSPLSVRPDLQYPVSAAGISSFHKVQAQNVVPGGLNNIQPDTSTEKGYLNTYVSLMIFGESDLSLPNSSATRFYVDDEEGFNLTNTDVYMECDETTGPVILEVYSGYEISTSQLLFAQEFTASENGYSSVDMDEQIYFEQGSYFWLVFHVPPGNKYPLGGGLELESEYSTNCYYSTNVGETWSLFEDLYYDARVVWAVYAISSQKNLDRFIVLEPESGLVESNEQVYITASVDGTDMINGEYKSNLVLNINETDLPYIKIPVNVTVTGHKPELTSVKRNDFGGVIIGNVRYLTITVKNEGLGRFLFSDPSIVFSNDQFRLVSDFTKIFEANTSQSLKFSFTPDTPGFNHCFVNLMGQNGIKYTFELIGTALEPPVAVLNPEEAIYNNIALGDSIEGELYIKNSGKYPLDFYLPAFADGSNMETLPENIQKYGYTYQVDTLGTSFIWQDISSTGTDITSNFTGNTMNNIYHHIDLNFQFPFYGEKQEGVDISKYGVLSFADQNAIWSLNPMAFKSNVNPDKYISACGFPMQFFDAGFGHVYYQQFSDKLIVQYEDAPYWYGESYDRITYEPYKASITLQIVLNDNGDIDMYYKTSSLKQFDALYSLIAMEDRTLDDGIRIKGNKWKDWENSVRTDFYYQDRSSVHIKNPGLGLITEVTNPYGTVVPGDSILVTYKIKTDSLLQMSYTENMLIVTNDPVSNPVIHQIQFSITSGGSSSVSTDTKSLEFDTLFVGAKLSKTLYLLNTGNAIDSILSVSFDNDNYAFTGSVPDILKPNRKLAYSIFVMSDTPGQKDDTLRIYTRNEVLKVALSGFVTEGPGFLLQKTSGEELTIVSKFLAAGNSTSYDFLISNNGAVDLQVAPVSNEWASVRELEASVNEFNYAYEWKTSGEFGGPSYDWIEIAGEGGTKLEGLDSYSGPQWSEGIALPFSFNFYGNYYDTIYIGANGILTFTKGQDEYGYLFGVSDIPMEGIPDNYIAPLWLFGGPDWIELFPLSGLYYLVEDDRIIVEYRDYNSAFSMGDPISYEAILYKNGMIKFQYVMPTATSNTVTDKGVIGIENEDGTDGVEVSNNSLVVNSDMSIALFPVRTWNIAPGKTKNFSLDMSAADLTAGSYSDSLQFITNDPYALNKKLPVKLIVSGTAEISKPDTIDFGDVLIDPSISSSTIAFEITNPGSANFTISGMTQLYPDKVDIQIYHQSGGSGVWENIHTALNLFPLTVAAKKSLKLKATIGTDANDLINELLSISTSLPASEQQIHILAAIYNSPVIQISEDTISFYAETAAYAISHNLYLGNTGEYFLNYTAELEYTREATASLSGSSVDNKSILSGEMDQPLSFMKLETPSDKKGVSEVWNFNRILSYDDADTAVMRLGYGGAQPFYVATGFVAPDDGYNLTHVQSWIVQDEWLDANIEVQILGGNDDINSATLLYSEKFESKISNTDVYGGLMTFELSQNISFYPKEKFFVVFVYESAMTYPQGCINIENNIANRYMFGAGSGYYDLSEYDEFSEIGWMIRAVEETSGTGAWVVISSDASGSIEMGSSDTLVLDIKAQRANKGDNYAMLKLKSNDVSEPLREVVIHLRKNDGPVFIPDNDLIVNENDTLIFNVMAFDQEQDMFSIKTPENPYTKILSTSLASFTYNGKEMAGQLLSVRFTPDFSCQGANAIEFSGEDSFGNESSSWVNITVKNVNRAPEAIQFDTIYLSPYGDPVHFYPYDLFTDQDQDIETVSAEVDDPDVIELYVSGNNYYLQPLDEGVTAIVFTATDSYNKSAVNVLNIRTKEGAGIITTMNDLFRIYPNPVKNILQLQLNMSLEEDLELTIYNAAGIAVKEFRMETGTNGTQVDMSGFDPGLYLIRLKGDSTSAMEKILKI